MSLVEHAKRELELLGETDTEFVDCIIRTIAAFSSYGHSGGSASAAIPIINALLQQKNLTPLTTDPSEWSEIYGGVYQNRRNGDAFSLDRGKTYYLLSEGATHKKPYPWHVTGQEEIVEEEQPKNNDEIDNRSENVTERTVRLLRELADVLPNIPIGMRKMYPGIFGLTLDPSLSANNLRAEAAHIEAVVKMVQEVTT